MTLASFVDWLLRRSARGQTEFNYVTIDRSGNARFDVAGYLASEEGGKALKKISAANRRLAKKVETAMPETTPL